MKTYVRCINNKWFENRLTVGKVYARVCDNQLSGNVFVIDDQGGTISFGAERFELVPEINDCSEYVKVAKATRHVHADLMARYAADAQRSNKPWLNWEFRLNGSSEWKALTDSPSWMETVDYRRKGDNFNVTVPRGSTQRPTYNQSYYFPDTSNGRVIVSQWYNDRLDNIRFDLGLVYPNEKQAQEFIDALKVK